MKEERLFVELKFGVRNFRKLNLVVCKKSEVFWIKVDVNLYRGKFEFFLFWEKFLKNLYEELVREEVWEFIGILCVWNFCVICFLLWIFIVIEL